jgi:5-(carboxyamino)imidazole ribonucleotide mutase
MSASPPVAIIMGSRSDWPTMKHAADNLDALGVAPPPSFIESHPMAAAAARHGRH